MSAKTDTATKTQKSEQAKKQQVKIKLSVMPNAGYRAKGVYYTKGLGIYDGKYVAKKVIHTVSSSSGYTVDIEAYREAPDSGSGNVTGQNTPSSDVTTANNTRNNRPPVTGVTVGKPEGTVKTFKQK